MRSFFRDYVASVRPRGEPSIAVNGSLPCRPPPRPLHRWKCPPAGPENHLCAAVPALSRSHPSVAVWLLNCGLLNKSAQRVRLAISMGVPRDSGGARMYGMIYMVEMALLETAQRAEWDAWYVAHQRRLLSIPGFRASQRFEAIHTAKSPFVALHEVDSPDIFTGPRYRVNGGPSNTGEWQAKMGHWHRNLFGAD